MPAYARYALLGLLATSCTASPILPAATDVVDLPLLSRAAPALAAGIDVDDLPLLHRAAAAASSVASLPVIPDRSTLLKGVQPEIVQAGKITKAQISKISLPKVGAAINKAATALRLRKRATAAAPAHVSSTQVFVNWDDLQVPAGGTLLSAMGPFTDIQVAVGGTRLNGIALTDSLGKAYTLGNMAPGANVVISNKYSFRPGELFKSFFILSNKPATGDQIIVGLNFTTSTGGSYSVTPSVPIAVNGLNNVNVGSGMLGQIRGFSKSGSKVFDALDVNFVNTFTDPKVINVVYDSFTNNLFPAGNGITTSVGADSLDATNSTVAQSTTFTSSTTVASTSSWDQTVHGNFGSSFAVEGEIGIPFLAKSKVTTTVQFEVGRATTNGKSSTTTYLSSQAFVLACPAKKFCVGQASIVKYTLDTPFTATYQATTANGQTFTWPVRGTYNGADSTSARFVVQQYDSAPA